MNQQTDLASPLRALLKLVADNAGAIVIYGDAHPDEVNNAIDAAQQALDNCDG